MQLQKRCELVATIRKARESAKAAIQLAEANQDSADLEEENACIKKKKKKELKFSLTSRAPAKLRSQRKESDTSSEEEQAASSRQASRQHEKKRAVSEKTASAKTRNAAKKSGRSSIGIKQELSSQIIADKSRTKSSNSLATNPLSALVHGAAEGMRSWIEEKKHLKQVPMEAKEQYLRERALQLEAESAATDRVIASYPEEAAQRYMAATNGETSFWNWWKNDQVELEARLREEKEAVQVVAAQSNPTESLTGPEQGFRQLFLGALCSGAMSSLRDYQHRREAGKEADWLAYKQHYLQKYGAIPRND